MDVSKIVVLVMIAIAIGFLVFFEMNSRRNTRKQQQQAAGAKNPSSDAIDRG